MDIEQIILQTPSIIIPTWILIAFCIISIISFIILVISFFDTYDNEDYYVPRNIGIFTLVILLSTVLMTFLYHERDMNVSNWKENMIIPYIQSLPTETFEIKSVDFINHHGDEKIDALISFYDKDKNLKTIETIASININHNDKNTVSFKRFDKNIDYGFDETFYFTSLNVSEFPRMAQFDSEETYDNPLSFRTYSEAKDVFNNLLIFLFILMFFVSSITIFSTFKYRNYTIQERERERRNNELFNNTSDSGSVSLSDITSPTNSASHIDNIDNENDFLDEIEGDEEIENDIEFEEEPKRNRIMREV